MAIVIIFLPSEPGRQILKNPGPVKRGQTTIGSNLSPTLRWGPDTLPAIPRNRIADGAWFERMKPNSLAVPLPRRLADRGLPWTALGELH